MKRIKVLMIIPNFRASNGITSYAMNYFRMLSETSVQMDFCVYWDGSENYEQEVTKAGAKIFHLPSPKKLREHYRMCERIIVENDYDIIHDNSLGITIPILQTAKKHKVPIRILHSHNSKLGETRVKEIRNRLCVPIIKHYCTDYAACSDLAARALFENKDYTLVPNIISCDQLYYSQSVRSTVREQMDVGNKIIIGSVGRVVPQKNPYFAIDVIGSILKTRDDIEYWWIGSGSMLDEMRHHVDISGLKSKVKFLGNREDVISLYQAVDLFFLPSVFEGLPVTGVEAQAMGLPSIVSDTVTKEMVYTDLVEFVSLDAPIEIWVEVIEKQMKRIPDRRSYTEELENSVFSSVHAGERLESYYRRLLSKASR